MNSFATNKGQTSKYDFINFGTTITSSLSNLNDNYADFTQ